MISYYFLFIVAFIGVLTEICILIFVDREKKSMLKKVYAIGGHIACCSGAFATCWLNANYAGYIDTLCYIAMGLLIATIFAEIVYCIFIRKLYKLSTTKKESNSNS